MDNQEKLNAGKKIGLIFDIDGTIIDNMNIAFDLIKDLAQIYSIDIDEAFHEEVTFEVNEILHNVGRKSAGIKAFYHVSKRLKIPIHKKISFLLLTKKLSLEKIQKSSLVKGSEETLNLLIEDKRFEIGALTNASKHEVKGRFVGKEQILELFDGVVIAGDDVEKTKPDPEGIIKLSQIMGIPPDRMIMIGDTKRDILTGKKIGALTIGVLSGFIPKSDFESVNADFIFGTISEIPKNLEKIMDKINSREI